MPDRSISADLWRRAEPVFDHAIELDPAARRPYLDAACSDDPELRRVVDSLLQAGEAAGDFLGGNALALVTDPWEREAAPRAPSPVGRLIGPYRILREVGRGGMGAVYEAVREGGPFHLRAALKLAPPAPPEAARLRERILAEGRVLARLEHPHIARLLDGGVTELGEPWLAMEYIEGTPLVAWCDSRRVPIPGRLRLFLQVCDATAYAHSRGVIHRDLKPANILVTGTGEAKLVDFGIAKSRAPDATQGTPLTLTGPAPRTPEYASPEQLRDEPVTPASDVYALGVVLFELLCGRRPLEAGGQSPIEWIRMVSEVEPVAPSTAVTDAVAAVRAATSNQLSRSLRGDLDTIALAALRKEPSRRYAGAEALGRDLERYLAGEPVWARLDGPVYRARKWARRRRVGALA
ncbi:MAG: serine/threonine-protein kinase, partial [Gemmatimonadales bacterium]